MLEEGGRSLWVMIDYVSSYPISWRGIRPQVLYPSYDPDAFQMCLFYSFILKAQLHCVSILFCVFKSSMYSYVIHCIGITPWPEMHALGGTHLHLPAPSLWRVPIPALSHWYQPGSCGHPTSFWECNLHVRNTYKLNHSLDIPTVEYALGTTEEDKIV